MKQKLLIASAIFLMFGGLWWQLKGSPNGSANNEPSSPTTVTTDPNNTEPDDYFDQQDPTNPQAQPPGGTVNGESLATDEDLARCVPVEDGFGIVMKDWGKIRLPYSDTWPKNEPGTPVDCAPDSDFGAAVVAAHSLYLESFSPELIPEIAEDTPGRAIRIEKNTEKFDPTDLARSCQPLGWDKPQDGISIWNIYHQCEDDTLDVTPIRMKRKGDQWLMVYNIDGRISIEEAPPETPYYPFEGGD